MSLCTKIDIYVFIPRYYFWYLCNIKYTRCNKKGKTHTVNIYTPNIHVHIHDCDAYCLAQAFQLKKKDYVLCWNTEKSSKSPYMNK
jgi:hypothetical protein